jgi:hypothetical protein
MSGKPEKSETSTALAMMGGAGILACVLFSPTFIVDAMDQTDLRNNGHETLGEVIEHNTTRRSNRTKYSASIRYFVGDKAYTAWIQGPGAQVSLLPLGTKVPVRFLASKPDFYSINLPEASSGGGPGWVGLTFLWGITIAFLGGAWFTRSSRKFQPNNTTQNK